VYSGFVPADIWNQAVKEGWLDAVVPYGITYKLTGQFCSSDYWGPA
jgi:hypothetical protein